jgi:hypothetical protein
MIVQGNYKIGCQTSVVTDAATWESATYLQEEKLRLENISIEESTLDDIAMVIRTDNPYNPKTKVLIIAGIRGIGTWGAAKYLRQNAKELNKITKGKDFACLLKVTYDRWRIKKVEISDTMKVF